MNIRARAFSVNPIFNHRTEEPSLPLSANSLEPLWFKAAGNASVKRGWNPTNLNHLKRWLLEQEKKESIPASTLSSGGDAPLEGRSWYLATKVMASLEK